MNITYHLDNLEASIKQTKDDLHEAKTRFDHRWRHRIFIPELRLELQPEWRRFLDYCKPMARRLAMLERQKQQLIERASR